MIRLGEYDVHIILLSFVEGSGDSLHGIGTDVSIQAAPEVERWSVQVLRRSIKAGNLPPGAIPPP